MTPSFALFCIGFGLLLMAAALWVGGDDGPGNLLNGLTGLLGVVLFGAGVLSLIVQALIWAAST